VDKQQGLDLVQSRIEDFGANKLLVMKKGYGETNIRTNYIDVMFEALGWDIRNKYEVDREFSQKDKSKEANTKKVDYAFKINGKLKFFIEAKEASVNLENNKDAIYQAKRYAYSSNGKAPIVILTDFEEFRVFNVLTAPLYNNPDKQLLKSHSLQYTDYIDKWDLLWNTFSREAVENGSLDELRGVITKNTKTMDKDFLEQITQWREVLAKNIAIRNEELTVEEINEAVQRVLDRLIFIRNLEDRDIEPENTLLDIAKKKTDILKSLIPLFSSLNKNYNGLLFKPHFSEDICIDDKTLYGVIRDMCYPISPFQFDVIEPEILGRIYEKFLGSKIRLTDGHRAKVEEKLEVRKAGGVFYTPEYIVEYIVNNTVANLVKDKAPDEIKTIKIADPACGSGSFLIGVYGYLLDYHKKWYSKNKSKKKYKNDWYETKDGEIVVSFSKRGEILKDNIFGVDIDKEATEVAIMSLYLKMLDEGYDKGQMDLFFVKGSILPDMTLNIKCGNSLIGESYFNQSYLNIEEEVQNRLEIKPFDWHREFSEIFDNGGFDLIIGNPPYFSIDDTWGKKDPKLSYIKANYTEVYNDKTDILFYFIQKAIHLSKNKIGYIVSRAFLEAYKADKLRAFISNKKDIEQIIDFRNYYVFEGVGITSLILILGEKDAQVSVCRKMKDDEEKPDLASFTTFDTVEIEQSQFSSDIWAMTNREDTGLLEKIDNGGQAIDSILVLGKGMETGSNNVFGKRSLEDIEKLALNDGEFFVRARNSHIEKYSIKKNDEYLLYIEDYDNFRDLPSPLQEYLKTNQGSLKKRAAYQRGDCVWWKYTWPLHKDYYSKTKILCPYMAKENRFAIDEKGEFLGLTDTTVLFDNGQPESLYYLLGLLNSKLLTYRFRFLSKLKSGGIYEYFWNNISKLPIRRIDFNNDNDVRVHSKVEEKVKKCMELKEKKKTIKQKSEVKAYDTMIDRCISDIDKLVYDLYDISETERMTVEDIL